MFLTITIKLKRPCVVACPTYTLILHKNQASLSPSLSPFLIHNRFKADLWNHARAPGIQTAFYELLLQPYFLRWLWKEQLSTDCTIWVFKADKMLIFWTQKFYKNFLSQTWFLSPTQQLDWTMAHLRLQRASSDLAHCTWPETTSERNRVYTFSECSCWKVCQKPCRHSNLAFFNHINGDDDTQFNFRGMEFPLSLKIKN